MVFFNGEQIITSTFPNNEKQYKAIQSAYSVLECIWEGNDDLFNVLLYKKFCDDKGYGPVDLIIRFFPYAQSDREMGEHIFTLKYVAQLINDAKFNKVIVLDPHSNVLAGCLDRCTILPINKYIPDENNYDLYFYPDNGAAKKYSECLKHKYRYGNKRRDLDTGKILEYEVLASEEEIKGKKILIIDDICIRGGTFKAAAAKLNEMGASQVDLYITHLMPVAKEFCENKKEYGITKIYSPNTLELDWYKGP